MSTSYRFIHEIILLTIVPKVTCLAGLDRREVPGQDAGRGTRVGGRLGYLGVTFVGTGWLSLAVTGRLVAWSLSLAAVGNRIEQPRCVTLHRPLRPLVVLEKRHDVYSKYICHSLYIIYNLYTLYVFYVWLLFLFLFLFFLFPTLHYTLYLMSHQPNCATLSFHSRVTRLILFFTLSYFLSTNFNFCAPRGLDIAHPHWPDLHTLASRDRSDLFLWIFVFHTFCFYHTSSCLLMS